MPKTPDRILLAMGRAAEASTWNEYLAASMTQADIIKLMSRPGQAVAAAYEVLPQISDEVLRGEVERWLGRLKELLEGVRHPLVHGLPFRGGDGKWGTAHPKALRRGAEVDLEILTARIDELEQHFEDGAGLPWRVANDRQAADSARTKDHG